MLQNPSAERNKEPVLEVLQKYIPRDGHGMAMDFSAGVGIQLVHFAKHFSSFTWQPTELDPQCLDSIKSYSAHSKLQNIRDPVKVDASTPVHTWANKSFHSAEYDFIVNINLIHISPWSATQGLFKGAGFLLKPGAYLFTYGPYAVNGKLTPESNVQFDRTLKQRNPEWGIRDVKNIEQLALENGLQLEKMIDRPANNKVLVFKKIST